MEVTISNEIIVKEPSAVLIQWAREKPGIRESGVYQPHS